MFGHHKCVWHAEPGTLNPCGEPANHEVAGGQWLCEKHFKAWEESQVGDQEAPRKQDDDDSSIVNPVTVAAGIAMMEVGEGAATPTEDAPPVESAFESGGGDMGGAGAGSDFSESTDSSPVEDTGSSDSGSSDFGSTDSGSSDIGGGDSFAGGDVGGNSDVSV